MLLSLLLLACNEIETPESTEVTGYNHYTETQDLWSYNLDVLVLQDDSGSMQEEEEYSIYETDRDRVRDNFPTIFEDLFNSDINWQVGLANMNPFDRSMIIVDQDNPSAETTIENSGTPPYDESGMEWGLAKSMASLIIDENFHRDNADLHVVFIADEDDDSRDYRAGGYETLTTDEYIDLMDSLKSQSFEVSETAIVTSTTCSTTSSNGTRYKEVSEVDLDICRPNEWSAAFDYSLEQLPKPVTIFALEHKALASTIYLYIDGVSTYAYSFDPIENTVTLDFKPSKENLELEIKYQGT